MRTPNRSEQGHKAPTKSGACKNIQRSKIGLFVFVWFVDGSWLNFDSVSATSKPARDALQHQKQQPGWCFSFWSQLRFASREETPGGGKRCSFEAAEARGGSTANLKDRKMSNKLNPSKSLYYSIDIWNILMSKFFVCWPTDGLSLTFWHMLYQIVNI